MDITVLFVPSVKNVLGISDDIYFEGQGLGSDQYYSNAELPTTRDNHRAGAVFFDYNPARSEVVEGEGNALGDAYGSLTYGFARKYTYLNAEILKLLLLNIVPYFVYQFLKD